MTLEEFINTDPNGYGQGNVNLLYSSSVVNPGIDNTPIAPFVVQGVCIPYTSKQGTDITAILKQITSFTFNFDGTQVNASITGKQKRTGYFYYTVEDFSVNTLPSGVDPLGNPYQEDESFIFIPYTTANFNNNDYNPLINNSEGSKRNVVAKQVDRNASQTIPTNLEAIIANSANPAELQNCSYTKIGIISSRYVGSKSTGAGPSYELNKEKHTNFVLSNLIAGNRPALAFKSFNSSIHNADADTTTIIGIQLADRELTEVYFDSVKEYTGSSVTYPNFPSVGRYLYSSEGNKLIRLVNSKIYSIDKGQVYTTDEFGQVTAIA